MHQMNQNILLVQNKSVLIWPQEARGSVKKVSSKMGFTCIGYETKKSISFDGLNVDDLMHAN